MFNRLFLAALLSANLIYTNTGLAAASFKRCADQQQIKALTDNVIRNVPPAAGLSIAIYNPTCGQITYTHGYADHKQHLQMEDSHQMPIASNTKPVLIALALLLIEDKHDQFPNGINTKLTEIRDAQGQPIFTADGKLNLPNGEQLDLSDSDLYRTQTGQKFNCQIDSTYQCPKLDAIDLHHLLIESSGLNDFFYHQDLKHTGLPDFAKYILSRIFSVIDGSKLVMDDVQTIKTFGLYKTAEPDPIQPTQSHNIDALLLSIILERTSGEPLNQLLYHRILKPLHLDKDSMSFITQASSDEKISRRYAYLNTDEEVEDAIEHHTLLAEVTPELARMLTPLMLGRFKRDITYISDIHSTQTRPSLDVLSLDGQGFTMGYGAGGMIAQPKAYIQFYRALANGSLLSRTAQKIFNDSFLNQDSADQYQLSIGYGSNRRLQKTLSNGSQLSFMVHHGFVLGGQSIVVYDEKTDTATMIATNFSGYEDGKSKGLPAFFVTKTPYFNDKYLMGLSEKYLELYAQ
jgi:CubicO group peptidase (beta-lactamase class C family)